MNEPHDVPDLSLWADTVQAAVTAIRMAGATQQMILLPGTDFTGAQTFVSNGSAGNLSRVHNLDGSTAGLIFDVHKYLDSDGSGTGLECISDHVQDTFTPLAQFLVTNGRKAILSETGGGNTTSVCHFSPSKYSRLTHKVYHGPMQRACFYQHEHRSFYGVYRLGSRRLLTTRLQFDINAKGLGREFH